MGDKREELRDELCRLYDDMFKSKFCRGELEEIREEIENMKGKLDLLDIDELASVLIIWEKYSLKVVVDSLQEVLWILKEKEKRQGIIN